MVDVEYSEDKLKELIVYFSMRSLDDPHFGKTKLNKMLFFSDFDAFRSLGTPITGAVYQHLPQGPCPLRLLPVLEQLKGDVIEVPEQVFGYTQHRLVATRSPDLEMFSKDEIVVMEGVLARLRPLTNKQASDLSHETMAWRLTDDKQEIPYGTALLSSDEPSEDDLAWLEGALAGEPVDD